MRFKVDENLHEDVAALLAGRGHDAQTVREEGLRGSLDAILADHCWQESRTLVTLDLDFADIRQYPPQSTAGIIVLRVSNQSRPHILTVMGQALDLLDREPVQGRLWIVTEAGVRIRGA